MPSLGVRSLCAQEGMQYSVIHDYHGYKAPSDLKCHYGNGVLGNVYILAYILLRD